MPLQLIPHLHKATHQVGLLLDRHRADLAVSQAEAHVLAHLAAGGPCSIAQLHDSFGHKRSTLTSILNRLEDRELVVRRIHPKDRRSYMLELTKTGRPLGKKVLALLEAIERRVIASVGRAGAETFVATATALGGAADEEG